MRVSEHHVSFEPLTVKLLLLGGNTHADRYHTEEPQKPKDAPYKVTDRDGMYVTVSTAGAVRSAMTTGSIAGVRR